MNYRVISVKQPWASLLLAGVKKYEVRSWTPGYTGYLILHASSTNAIGLPKLRRKPLFQRALRLAGLQDESRWPRSAAIGVIEVIRVWDRYEVPARRTKLDALLGATRKEDYRWQIGRRWAFKNVVTCHGKLGLWTPPRRVYNAVRKLRLPRERFRAISH